MATLKGSGFNTHPPIRMTRAQNIMLYAVGVPTVICAVILNVLTVGAVSKLLDLIDDPEPP